MGPPAKVHQADRVDVRPSASREKKSPEDGWPSYTYTRACIRNAPPPPFPGPKLEGVSTVYMTEAQNDVDSGGKCAIVQGSSTSPSDRSERPSSGDAVAPVGPARREEKKKVEVEGVWISPKSNRVESVAIEWGASRARRSDLRGVCVRACVQAAFEWGRSRGQSCTWQVAA
ncbi:hypothetical protein EW146_g10331 [Bondarzewia mesenterica]|uniref:Uncharacterized protein n=1 Tax=Bondarzewia mesenterica TaxID=1095465 RepID=A0A4S4KY66_9AGAM|nr:hypothetical protein EW146_g10331 [Bondarzewia mesenterica]